MALWRIIIILVVIVSGRNKGATHSKWEAWQTFIEPIAKVAHTVLYYSHRLRILGPIKNFPTQTQSPTEHLCKEES